MTAPLFNIVLVKPEIPQNTGGIGRLCASASARLHLIEPLGFSLDDKYLKRAGMDYWRHVDYAVYPGWENFLSENRAAELYFFSTKSSTVYWDCPFNPGAFLIFGNESSGLPPDFYLKYGKMMYTIPMPGRFCRSLNLANSAAIVLYEGLRKQADRFPV